MALNHRQDNHRQIILIVNSQHSYELTCGRIHTIGFRRDKDFV